jgi:4-amino-4-deoxy-L-arabinose transferase-like glycosyltransferase
MDSRQSRDNRASYRLHRGAGPAVFLIIAVYIAFWTLEASVSGYNLDTHGDMVENFAWGIGWQLGYYKHPPFFAWSSAAWFLVFPRSNVSYHLLSATSVAVAMWAMWRISTRFFTRDQQILLVASAFFLPALTFLAQNYNATSAMLPLWALTFLFYLRLIERRSALDAVLLGIFAALAVLAKYHSVVLLFSIAAHLVLDREVRPIFRTYLPWLTVLAGSLALAPHLIWMIQNDFVTITYASTQGSGNWRDALIYAARFLPVIVLYALPVFVLLIPHRYFRDGLPIFAVDQWRAFRKTAQGRALISATVLPPLVTIALALALNAQVSSLWAIPFFVFLPFFLVALLPRELATRQKFVVPIVMAVYAAVLLALAPSIKERTLREARGNSATPVDAIADLVEARWRDKTGRAIVVVAGDNMVANALSFYASDQPYAIQQSSLSFTPWVTVEDIEKAGGAYICLVSPADTCRAAAMRLFGRIDAEESLHVPAVPGAGGPSQWDVILAMRYPAP